jgi:hypothetical protein
MGLYLVPGAAVFTSEHLYDLQQIFVAVLFIHLYHPFCSEILIAAPCTSENTSEERHNACSDFAAVIFETAAVISAVAF